MSKLENNESPPKGPIDVKLREGIEGGRAVKEMKYWEKDGKIVEIFLKFGESGKRNFYKHEDGSIGMSTGTTSGPASPDWYYGELNEFCAAIEDGDLRRKILVDLGVDSQIRPSEVREALKPQPIHIYAVQTTRATEDWVTSQGFGRSKPLNRPETTTTFYWEGNLFPNQSMPGNAQGLTHSFGFRGSIEQLAENFAENYRGRQNPDLQNLGSASYSFTFEPPNGNTLEGARVLSSTEKEEFLTAFQRANIKATTGN